MFLWVVMLMVWCYVMLAKARLPAAHSCFLSCRLLDTITNYVVLDVLGLITKIAHFQHMLFLCLFFLIFYVMLFSSLLSILYYFVLVFGTILFFICSCILLILYYFLCIFMPTFNIMLFFSLKLNHVYFHVILFLCVIIPIF